MVTVVTGGSNPGRFTVRLTADGVSNSADKELQMNMDMSLDSDAPDFPEDMENINMQMYKVADWLYIKMDMPFLGEQWIKAPVDEDTEKYYDLNLIDEQLALLGSPGKIEPLREEIVDGSLCDVMNIFPDAETLFEWVQEQDSSGVEMDLDQWDMIAETFQDFSFLVWITKDTRQIKKMMTATAGGPNRATAASLINIDSTISNGWKRRPVVQSKSTSAWCTMCSRHSAGTA